MRILGSYRLVFPLIFLIAFVAACSTEKDAAINRGYHNMTARFNGYYNAGVVIETALNGYRSTYVDEYYKIIPLEVYPAEKDAPGLFPDMDKAIEKCERVILRHSMPNQEKKKKDEELCRWIDDNWLVIAQAHYYKREYALAEQKFNYVQKTYNGQESVYEAQIWLAKTYIAMGNFPEAKRILAMVEISMEEAIELRDRKFFQKIKDIKSNRAQKKKNKKKKITAPAPFPEDLIVDYEATMADFYIQQGEYKQAIEHLEKAIGECKNKRRKARYMFVLAQLYQALGDSNMATLYYTKVANSSAPYEMQFAAKINKALNATSGGEAIRKDLYKMLRDEKNAEFKDQIYYALAEMDMKDGDVANAKINYTSSVYWSVKNDRQKGISYLRMADIHFEERDYIKAQKYYDSCVTVLPKDYEGYAALENKAEGLEDLVINYETMVFEDSVQRIAAMDPEAREKFLKQTLKDIIAAEELRKKQEQERLLATQDKVNNQQASGSGEGSKWYFYNTKVRGSGFNDFRAQWGTRPLEDNWRRSDRNSFEVETDNPDGDSLETDVKKDSLTVDDLLADIPLTQGALDSSNNRLINAMYMLGVIYKEQLKEEAEAISYFNKVIDRGIEHPRVLESMYQLYLIYSKKGSAQADTYKQMIIDRYPDTEIAKLMRDPDYLRKKEEESKKELNEYAVTLNDYKQRYYGAVISKCNEVIAYDTTNKFLNKYYLLKAFAVSKTSPGNVEAIASPLQALYDLSPDSEEGKQAKVYLDKIYAGGSITNPDEQGSIYKPDSGAQHFFIVIIPTSAGGLETNKVKLANFNNEYFRAKRYTVINSVLTGDQELLVVKTFADAEEGKQFVAAFNSTPAPAVLGTMPKDFEGFLINSANFSTLMTSKDLGAYRTFYQQNY